jgi:FixJ family two-component response regulator
LREWLKQPVSEAVPRNELLLKLFFGAHVPPHISREHVEVYMEARQKDLQVYDALAKGLRKKGIPDSQLPFCLMTLNMGRHRSVAMVKWCRETLAELDKMEGKGKGGK